MTDLLPRFEAEDLLSLESPFASLSKKAAAAVREDEPVEEGEEAPPQGRRGAPPKRDGDGGGKVARKARGKPGGVGAAAWVAVPPLAHTAPADKAVEQDARGCCVPLGVHSDVKEAKKFLTDQKVARHGTGAATIDVFTSNVSVVDFHIDALQEKEDVRSK